MDSMFGSQQPPGTPAASEVTDNFAALREDIANRHDLGGRLWN